MRYRCITASWDELDIELRLWQQHGLIADFWWRDDDAVESGSQLNHLLQLSSDMNIPVSLAVIPTSLQGSLLDRVADIENVSVLLHGYRHKNLAPSSEKKNEFPCVRSTLDIRQDLVAGIKILSDSFAQQFIPVLVPPWNRYCRTLLEELGELGVVGMSAMWARDPLMKATLQVNTHCDPVDWMHSNCYVGDARALGWIVAHLRAKRAQPELYSEPSGLLTHHLDQNADCWSFCQRFMLFVNARDNVRWLSATDIWGDSSS